jgi:hypothetical protein
MVKVEDTNDNKKKMLEALEKSLGIVTTACKLVGIARETHYRWMREDAEYKEAADSISDVVLDFAESKLHNLIDGGDTAATIFYMKTKGKKRGYIERQELTGPDNQPVITISANL